MEGISATTDELGVLKEEFLATLNHEIRTPLSGILGMVDLLFETELQGEQKEYLDAVRICAESLLRVMNSTLEYSALSADKIVLEECEFSLRDVLTGALEEFAFEAKAKGLKLSRYFQPDLAETVIGDAVRLREVIGHVVANAIKFTKKGEVEVRVSSVPISDTDMLLSLAVRDTGIGIPGDKLDDIFQSFRQLETGLARGYTGMGLGLAVTQKLVKLMNGRVLVQSELGKGSEFTISIPLEVASAQSEAAAVLAASPIRQMDSFRILVVEDDAVARTVTAHVLRRKAYHVDCAADGASAWEAVRSAQYDLILMDLQLPDVDGLRIAARIRDLRAYATTPILALTGDITVESRNLCRQQGLQGFLLKPVQSSELLRAVETYVPTAGPSVRPPTSIAV